MFLYHEWDHESMILETSFNPSYGQPGFGLMENLRTINFLRGLIVLVSTAII